MIVEKNLLLKSERIHLVGIGGIGVSALAGILIKHGKQISGSDKENSSLTDQLALSGAQIFTGHFAANLKNKPDLVVHSLAIDKNNPELKEALKRKIPILSYPQAVGQLTNHYFTIAICGTHGKSTTTAMLAKILIENNFDPNVIVGTKLKELDGKNFRVGKSKILVLEACEYKRAFLNYNPHIIVLHTLDPDHLDYYRDFKDYMSAFREFALKLPHDGYFFANLDDEDIHDVLQTLQKTKFPQYNIFSYAHNYSNSDYYLSGNKIFHKNEPVGELKLQVPGEHNRSNALAAFSVASMLGIKPRDILKSLNHYTGASRRFETIGKIGKTTLIDDYAHHPEEIKATLAAAREKFGKKQICVVFQPHQYNRTKNFLKEFGKSFADADMVIIPNIYEVRDSKSDKSSVSAETLVKEISKHHPRVLNGNGMAETTEFLKKNAKQFSVIFNMGAGDVWKISRDLSSKR
jgi:UDP-N-acetylmuramate--alanine ligase